MADPVFVNDVTPLNAVNMNKLQTRDEKAQANGFASLGADGKVPSAQLPTPAPAGADLSYDGDWVAGTYQDGDVVVKDGIAFLCVGGPTVVAPNPALWGLAVPDPAGAPALTLPASPVDGQVAILTDAASNFMWQFKYMASWGAQKWACIGGTPRKTDPTGSVTVSAHGTYNEITGMQTVVFPRAGWYFFTASVLIVCTVFGGVTTAMCRMQRSVSGGYDADRQMLLIPAQYTGARVARTGWIDGQAGETLSVQMGLQGGSGSTVIFSEAALELMPWGVS